jgi:hypothetical protein
MNGLWLVLFRITEFAMDASIQASSALGQKPLAAHDWG